MKIPCPYGGKCNFGHDCLYVHAEDEQWKIERLKEELQSFIGLILGYEFAKLNQTCLKELGGSVRRKDEMNVNVQEFKLGLDDDEELNDDEDGISETEDIFEMPSFDNEVEIVVMEKTLFSSQLIQPVQETKADNCGVAVRRSRRRRSRMASEEVLEIVSNFDADGILKGVAQIKEEKVNEIIEKEKSQTADLEKEKEKTRSCFCGGKNCPVCREDLSAEDLSMDEYDDKLKKMHFGGERGKLSGKRGRGVGRRGRGRRGRPPPFVEKW